MGPDAGVNSPEVQALIAAKLVQFISCSSNPIVPDSVLRLVNEPEARAVLRRYSDALPSADKTKLISQPA